MLLSIRGTPSPHCCCPPQNLIRGPYHSTCLPVPCKLQLLVQQPDRILHVTLPFCTTRPRLCAFFPVASALADAGPAGTCHSTPHAHAPVPFPFVNLQMLVQPMDRIFHIIRTNASQVVQALGTQEVGIPWLPPSPWPFLLPDTLCCVLDMAAYLIGCCCMSGSYSMLCARHGCMHAWALLPARQPHHLVWCGAAK